MHRQTIAVLAASGLAGAALAQSTPPDYGFTWRTIGDPGNPGASPADYFRLDRPVGEVDYSYRMTQTEVTNTQWIEFATAYKQVNPAVDLNDWAFTGRDIVYSQSLHAFIPVFGAENAPAIVSWMYAARFVNWLQNRKALTSSAFETGVYDLSTFVWHSDNTWTGQTTRAPGSQFWLPNLDEWDKAMHWDPDKHGPGQGGYWAYPNSSDTTPVGGPPGTPGAQTNAYFGAPLYQAAGSYPDQRSPWGLLDGSGGAEEYLDSWGVYAWTRGAAIGNGNNSIDDRLDSIDASYPVIAFAGIRLASSVPAPGVCGPTLLGLCVIARRKRR